MPPIIIVGEAMIELSRGAEPGCWRLHHGGDTLNTALHLARLGSRVGYLTALGSDPFSDQLRAAWTAEELDPALILTDPARAPGLYAITNNPAGERSFTYWRSDSAARQLFALPESTALVAAAATAQLLAFSLISLAILPESGRATLLDLARRVRAQGGRVAFDSNYRPRLWASEAEARRVHAAALAQADIGLPTLEDEAALHGLADPAAITAHWNSAGVAEVVVKQGAEGCWIAGELIPPPQRVIPRDTSGAGDAFNAGYLHARLAGVIPRAAATAGHRLAGWVVTRAGAIPDLDDTAPYAALTQARQLARPIWTDNKPAATLSTKIGSG